MQLLALLMVTTVQTADTVTFEAPVRDVSHSRAGHIAFSANGDLFVLPRSGADGYGAPVRVTSGPAWDHQPAWTPDADALVFASDRDGGFELWRVRVDGDLRGGAPERLTSDAAPAAEPAVGPDGTIVFVRGRNATADLWRRDPGGALHRVADRAGAEYNPALSPDGRTVAYVSRLRNRRELRTHSLEDGTDRRVLAGSIEHPVWSPDGALIAYTTRGTNGGVWVTPPTGRYSNLVSTRPAQPSWAPDGATLALAGLAAAQPGYNGDPHRFDRTTGDIETSGAAIWFVDAPRPADRAAVERTVTIGSERRALHAEAFDRVAARLESLYFTGNRRDEWTRFADRLRERALRAETMERLDDVIYELISERPTVHAEARGRAGVSSAHPLATEAGTRILRSGGNVVDAAIAVSFALGVVEPDASGIGGYGEMVLYLQGMERPTVIEFLTRVPEQAGLTNAALLSGGSLPADGPVLANVPGTVAGMHRAFQRYGSGNVTWADLVQPAIELARDGFVLDDAFTTTLDLERDRYLQYESSTALFFPGGEPLRPATRSVIPTSRGPSGRSPSAAPRDSTGGRWPDAWSRISAARGTR